MPFSQYYVIHRADSSVVFSICDLLRSLRISNFPIFFALEKYRHQVFWMFGNIYKYLLIYTNISSIFSVQVNLKQIYTFVFKNIFCI